MDKCIKYTDHLADRAAMATAVLEALEPGERPCDCQDGGQCTQMMVWAHRKKAYDEVSALLEGWNRD